MAFLVIEVIDEHTAMRAEGADEIVTAIGPGRHLPRRQRPPHLCKGDGNLNMLSFHAGHDRRLQAALKEQWPKQLVLAVVVVRQSGIVPGQMPADDGCSLAVAIRYGANEFAQQARLPTKGTVDDDHLMGVDHRPRSQDVRHGYSSLLLKITAEFGDQGR